MKHILTIIVISVFFGCSNESENISKKLDSLDRLASSYFDYKRDIVIDTAMEIDSGDTLRTVRWVDSTTRKILMITQKRHRFKGQGLSEFRGYFISDTLFKMETGTYTATGYESFTSYYLPDRVVTRPPLYTSMSKKHEYAWDELKRLYKIYTLYPNYRKQ